MATDRLQGEKWLVPERRENQPMTFSFEFVYHGKIYNPNAWVGTGTPPSDTRAVWGKKITNGDKAGTFSVTGTPQENRIRERSVGFPELDTNNLRKKIIGLLTSDAGSFADNSLMEKYPHKWKEEGGGVVKFNLEIDGNKYICIARMTARSEVPALAERNFIAYRALLIPEKDWSPAIIATLADNLTAEPPVGEQTVGADVNLQPKELQTNCLDQPLSPGWFSKDVAYSIAFLLSGQNVSAEDPCSIKEYLQKLFYVFICLPSQISKKESFGAGLLCSDGQVKIAQAHQTKDNQNMARKRDLESGSSTKGKWNKSPHQQARAYVDLLGTKIVNCKTPREVMIVVDSLKAEFVETVKAIREDVS